MLTDDLLSLIAHSGLALFLAFFVLLFARLLNGEMLVHDLMKERLGGTDTVSREQALITTLVIAAILLFQYLNMINLDKEMMNFLFVPLLGSKAGYLFHKQKSTLGTG